MYILMPATKAPLYLPLSQTHTFPRAIWRGLQDSFSNSKTNLQADKGYENTSLIQCSHQAYLYHIHPSNRHKTWPHRHTVLYNAVEIHLQVKQKIHTCWNTSPSIHSCTHMSTNIWPVSLKLVVQHQLDVAGGKWLKQLRLGLLHDTLQSSLSLLHVDLSPTIHLLVLAWMLYWH